MEFKNKLAEWLIKVRQMDLHQRAHLGLKILGVIALMFGAIDFVGLYGEPTTAGSGLIILGIVFVVGSSWGGNTNGGSNNEAK